MDRRTLLKWAVKLGGLVAAAVVGLPAVMTGFSPVLKGRPRERWLPLAEDVSSLEVGATRPALVELPRDDWTRGFDEFAVYVWRPRAGELVVFSRTCTDLGCPVNFDPGSACFFCPCHGGIFAQDGSRMAGPPNRPLYRYATRVRAGRVEIDLSSVPAMV